MPKGSEKKPFGFTLLEIILAIAVIAIMAGLLLVAIDPSKQLGKARNVERKSDVNLINEALYQYWLDEGDFPVTVTTTRTLICTSNVADCTGLVDLSVLTASGGYIAALPSDPSCATNDSTGYTIHRSQGTGGYIIIEAPCAEVGDDIYQPDSWIRGGAGDTCGSEFVVSNMDAADSTGGLIPMFDASGNLNTDLLVPSIFDFNDPDEAGTGIGNVGGGPSSISTLQAAINNVLDTALVNVSWNYNKRSLTLWFDDLIPTISSQAITGDLFIQLMDSTSTYLTTFSDASLEDLGPCEQLEVYTPSDTFLTFFI